MEFTFNSLLFDNIEDKKPHAIIEAEKYLVSGKVLTNLIRMLSEKGIM